MDSLLNPDTGLIIWTWVMFGILLAVLSKAAWKPIMKGLEEREGKIRSDIDRAEKAQKDADALRQKYESQLSDAQKSIQEMIAQAKSDGEKTRAQLVQAAKDEAERVLEKGKKDLANETDRIKQELRSELAELSLKMAEKVIHKAIEKNVVEDVVKESQQTLSEMRK